MKITNIKAREILDSRGNPTVEVELTINDQYKAIASTPSGASTGSKEALELRDNDEKYHGLGVTKAIKHINHLITPNILNIEFNTQEELDHLLLNIDSTPNKSHLGANAILPVSIAFLKATAKSKNQELYQYLGKENKIPRPMLNIINGGKHADNNLDIQEFMIIPQKETIKENLRIASEVFHTLKNILKEKGYNTNVGDEGGFAPSLSTNEEALDLITESITKSNYKLKEDVSIGLDVAASELYNKNNNTYKYNNEELTPQELLNKYINITQKYPIISIEDPFYEEDWESFNIITTQLKDIQIVGDDLFTTNKERLQIGINQKACNAILIKPNQIGTITETIETINLAQENNYQTIISHRSGETEDTFIADLAVGLSLGQIKAGSITRGERISKYNRLLRIEEELNNK